MEIYFIASLEENCRDKIEAIAVQLEQRGCKIKRILRFSGIIAGSVDGKTSLEQIKIPGIKYIEKDREVRERDEE